MKLIKTLANRGYGSRREVSWMFREGRITDPSGEVLYADDEVDAANIRVDGDPLDPPAGMVIALNKPLGYTCSTKDVGRVVFDLLPPRYRLRNPALSTVGRLDRDTSGLLLFTDDGGLLHRIISPKSQVTKTYEAELAEDLRGDEAATFASGELVLESEEMPLAPAVLTMLAPRRAHLKVTEGRYHQVRRMFAAVGNHVVSLGRVAIGELDAVDIAVGEWRQLNEADVARVFAPASATE